MKKILIAFLSLIIIAPAMSAPTQSTNASTSKTDSLQTKINVQVLYADRVPVKDMNIYYAQDTSDLNELSKDSNLSRYQINGNPQTDSDGKVTFYTGKRTGLVATSGVVTPIESEDWRTTRIMLTTPSPEKAYKGGSDASDNIATAGCSNDEIEHLGNDANLDDKGKCVSASSNGAINISGYVFYKGTNEPLYDVYLFPENIDLVTNGNSAHSLQDGSFTITRFPKNHNLIVAYYSNQDAIIKYDDILNDNDNLKIYIKESDNNQDTIIADNTPTGDCMTDSKKREFHALDGKWLGDEWQDNKRLGKCIPTKCENNYILENPDSNNAVCTPCATKIMNAERTHSEDDICYVDKCNDGFHHNPQKTSCIADCNCGFRPNTTTGECEQITDDDKNCTNTVVGATNAEWDCDENGNSYCKITACDTTNGYELADNKCECATGFERADDGTCTPKMVLTREQYQNQIKELSDNAQKMRDNENSLVNKTIGAAGIGVTGAGGMMLAQSLSETMSDANAERTMAAYLQTFKCDYGTGTQIKGGETNVELPGGNDMIGLYTEYATLANDLKTRKEALGLRPGIESEVSIDKSETGLYDDVGTGITGGGYASIARALQDPEGEDAAMWAAQKDTTKKTLIAGAVTAGVGAVGSLAANIAVNHNVKNDVDEIKQRYAAMKKPFENLQKSFDEEPQKTCAELYSGATGSDIDHCTCVDKDSYLTQDGCVKCETEKGLIINEEKTGCVCKDSNKILNGTRCEHSELPSLGTNINGGVSVPPQRIKTCTLRGLVTSDCECVSGAVTEESAQCKCDTSNGYVQQGSRCVCNEQNGYKPKTGGGCEKPQPTGDSIAQINIPADSLFDSGKADIKSDAKIKLDKFIEDTKATNVDLTDANAYCLVIVGKTDHQRFKKPDDNLNNNQSLSERRANAVKDYIKSTFNENAIRSMGIAATDCPTPKKNESRANEKCRRVNVIMLAGSCDDNQKNTDWINNENIADIETGVDAIMNQIQSNK